MKRHFLGACLLLAGSVPCLAIEPIFVPVGPELLPYGATPCCNTIGGVAMAADGSFAVLWTRTEAGSVRSSWVRRFAADGSPIAAALEVPVEEHITYRRNSLSSAPDGSFVLLSTVPAGQGARTLRVLRFQPSGQALAAVDVAVTHDNFSSVGHDGQGRFVVLWSESPFVRAARFDAAGNLLGSIFDVAQAGTGHASVQVAVAADGSFTAFYEKRDNPELDGQLHRRRYDAAGQPLGAEQPVATGVQLDSQAAAAADGFAAAVFSVVPGAYGALFDASGTQGASFTLWDDPADLAYVPLVAAMGNGDIAAAVTVAIDNLASSMILARIGRDGVEVGPPLVLATLAHNGGAGALASSGDRIVVFVARGNQEPFLQIYEAPLFADGFESGNLARWVP